MNRRRVEADLGNPTEGRTSHRARALAHAVHRQMLMAETALAFERILVPTDFGEAAARALDTAVSIAKKYGSTIVLLHVCDVPVYPYPGMLTDFDFVTPIREATQKELAATFSVLEKAHCKARTQLACGVVWSEILSAAADQKADLIVMGTRGRKGVMHALLGSVAEKLVRTSPVPVLTVRDARVEESE